MLLHFPDACPRITQPKNLTTNLWKSIQTIERIVNSFVPPRILNMDDKHTEKPAGKNKNIVNVIENAKNQHENAQPTTWIYKFEQDKTYLLHCIRCMLASQYLSSRRGKRGCSALRGSASPSGYLTVQRTEANGHKERNKETDRHRFKFSRTSTQTPHSQNLVPAMSTSRKNKTEIDNNAT